jgi:hypothetical protein
MIPPAAGRETIIAALRTQVAQLAQQRDGPNIGSSGGRCLRVPVTRALVSQKGARQASQPTAPALRWQLAHSAKLFERRFWIEPSRWLVVGLRSAIGASRQLPSDPAMVAFLISKQPQGPRPLGRVFMPAFRTQPRFSILDLDQSTQATITRYLFLVGKGFSKRGPRDATKGTAAQRFAE